MAEDKNIVLGVDIGGSHITAAAVDLDRFEIIAGTSFNREINNKASKEAIIGAWADTVREVLKTCIQTVGLDRKKVAGIGIAMPGPFDYLNGVGMFEGNDKYESLYKVDVREPLSQLVNIPEEKIHFFNDATSFAVGAALQQKVLHHRTVGLTLGTGFGAAFLMNGLPAAEHSQVPENGCLWDKSFKDGIADDYFSTRWFVRQYEAMTGQACKGVREIVAFNNAATHQVFEEFIENLTEFLAPHLERFKADVLMMGGNIAKAHPLFLEALKKSLGVPLGLQMEIVNNTESCNILGASHLMSLDYWKQQTALKAFI
ncbi:ROK family protein [Rufibacter sp. XAAS-G3-1]|uniref:ROK family protein n=1 Tax=Rufibacter sp. XAAS-G3-1 TaxID=2729134 RepID=UPI0015E6B93B|nr:ROK family protein [Rufibacter sp. XAAS-G3-1]